MVAQHTSDTSGRVPPGALARAVYTDAGSATPRFARATATHVPAAKQLAAEAAVPLGVLVQPAAVPGEGEEAVPVVAATDENDPVRCLACGAYVGPHTEWISGGDRMRCGLCRAVAPVPAWYACHLDGRGQRVDASERPELCRGTYDLPVGGRFSERPPQAPLVLFALDVGYVAQATGFFETALHAAAAAAAKLPGGARARVGLLCFDDRAHWFDLRGGGAAGGAPPCSVVGDTTEAFCPLPPAALFAPAAAGAAAIAALASRASALFPSNGGRPTRLLPVLRACLDGMRDCGGRVCVLTATGAQRGKGTPTDALSAYGTTDEAALLTPDAAGAWSALGEAAAGQHVAIDFFMLAKEPACAASLAAASLATGGRLRVYRSFEAGSEAEAQEGVGAPALRGGDTDVLVGDVTRALCANVLFETQVKIRCSASLDADTPQGPGLRRPGGVRMCPLLDEQSSLLVRLRVTGEAPSNGRAWVQAAVLHSTAEGERRVRVINLCLPTTTSAATLFESADGDATFAMLLREAAAALPARSVLSARRALVDSAAAPLAAYRRLLAADFPPSKLVMPKGLQLLPLFVNAALKHPALRVHEAKRAAAAGTAPPAAPAGCPTRSGVCRADERSALLLRLRSADSAHVRRTVYPHLYDVSSLARSAAADRPDSARPALQWASAAQLSLDGVALVDDGDSIRVSPGPRADPAVLSSLFGTADPAAVRELVPPHASPAAAAVHRLVASLRAGRATHCPLRVVSPSDNAAMSDLTHCLVEDKLDKVASYVDFLISFYGKVTAKAKQ